MSNFTDGMTEKQILVTGVGVIALTATSFAGWITHIVVCLQSEQWLLLIGGAIAVPVGVIHGIGCWFGWWA